MRHLILMLAVLVGTAATPGLAATRLPRSVQPVHYALHFEPDLQRARFRGRALIDIEVVERTRQVTLHAVGLDFTRAVVHGSGRPRLPRLNWDTAAETVTLELDEPLPLGRAQLEFAWDGVLDANLRGFYLGGEAGQRYAATQLQATDARRMFPAFDEPDRKARFTLSATVAEGLMAISNAALVSDTPGPGADRHTLRFATTPVLPSYLVALLVGDFECLSDQYGSVPLRVCALPGHAERGRYALDLTKQALAWFEEYYAQPLPFTKLDQVALPDFAWGAMENPGAIVYQEANLLLPEGGPAYARDMVAITVAHELAHLWFGDFVTLRWWDEIWLNEGFATWMEARVLREVEPDFDAGIEEVRSATFAIEADLSRGAEAMRRNVTGSAEIEAAFDNIAYYKSAAVLRMLEGWLGPERFREGVRTYLARHAWGNTTARDLAAALGAAADDQPVQRVLDSFVNQPGVPVVSLSSRCREGVRQVTVSQERFSAGGRPGRERPLWSIPVCLRTAEGERCELVSGRRTTLEVPGCDGPLFGNADARGYYLVDHDKDDRAALFAGFGALNPEERWAALRDEWWLFIAGARRVDEWLALHTSLSEDSDREQFVGHLLELERTLLLDADREAFARFARTFLAPVLTGPDGVDAGWSAILGRLTGDAGAVSDARATTARWLADPGAVGSGSALSAAPLAARFGDAELHDALAARLANEQRPEQRTVLLLALGAFRDPVLIGRNLERLKSAADLRPGDDTQLLDAMLRNPAAAERTWDTLKDGWNTFEQRWPPGHRSQVLESLSQTCDGKIAEEVHGFFRLRPRAAAAAEVLRAADSGRACDQRRSREGPRIGRFLARWAAAQDAPAPAPAAEEETPAAEPEPAPPPTPPEEWEDDAEQRWDAEPPPAAGQAATG